MLDNEDPNQSEKQNPEHPQGCSSTSRRGCCSPASDDKGKSWGRLIFFIVLAAVGIVLANSLAKKSRMAAEQSKGTYETNAQASAEIEEDTFDGVESALWGPDLDSLAALDEVATDVDTVFILICSQDQEDTANITSEIEAATETIRSRGNLASAFRLSSNATDYRDLAEQFSVPTVLTMVKGLGYSAVSEQITEANLLEAFVRASRTPSACCPPGTDPSQCGTADSGP